MNLINVLDFADEQRDDKLFFEALIYDVAVNVKDVIKDESLKLM